MKDGPSPSYGRIGWLCASLLFGVLAGGGIAWSLINRHGESPAVVIYQMPTPTPAASPGNTADNLASSLRRHRRTVHAAGDLPSVLDGAQVTAAPTPVGSGADLAAGIDGSAAADPTPSGPNNAGSRQTVLVDGIAITQPASPATPTPRPAEGVLYDANSTQVDDSIALAIEGLEKYVMQKGYTLREDTWGGELIRGKAKAISHQLFKGNDYWFSMGCSAAGSTVRVRLYDSDGNPADTNYWQHEASDGSYAAAEIQCQHTGTYFVVVFVERSPEERVPWGLVYAYR